MTDKEKAIETTIRRLFYCRFLNIETGEISAPLIAQHETIKDVLNEAIYLGGGFSLDNCGDYWAVDYSPGVKIKLLKRDNGDIIYEQIPRTKIFEFAKQLIAEYKNECIQLDLFTQK